MPFKDEINISFYNVEAQECTITIHNWIGKVLEKKTFKVGKGKITHTLNNLGYLWNGTYVLTVKTKNITLTKKIVK